MKNQKGFTIVELLIGMTILSIVAVALTGFIVSSSKSYAAANTEILVQQESQLAMNQMSDVIIDTTRSVNYVGFSMDGSVSEQAVKDADFTIDVEDKCLVLYNGEGTIVVDANGNPVLDADGNPEIAKDADGKPIITGGNGNKNYQIYWDKSEEKLFFTEIENSETDFPESDREVLAEYVKDFSVDLSQVEEKRVVKITISYEYNHRTYETSNNITIRNKVLVNNVNLAVNKSVELNIRPKENMVVLEPGEDYYKFSTPVIDGRNVIDKSVTWSISTESAPTDPGAGRTEFTDAANGIIHISSGEMANSFKVTVTTNAVDSAGNHASADVIVYVKRVKSVALNKSEDSDAENGAFEISANSTFTISAHAEGNKLGVTCSDCGDDTAIDRYVVENENPYRWNLIDTNGICTMTSSGHESAEFTISSSAQPGQQITIEATSLLSTTSNAIHRNYDKVTGSITLKVADRGGDLTLDGSFRYGDEPLTLNWDYPHAYAVVCVRIKEEDPNAPMANDRVMIFNTDGYAIRIGADLFGLDLNHNYYISMQVLDYQLNKYSWDYEAKRNQLVAEYTGHLDSTGTYIGEISSSSKLTVPLLKPQITFVYNDKEYTGEEINISPISALLGGTEVSCKAIKVSSTRDDGVRVINDVKVNLYQGSGEDLYVYDVSTGQYIDKTYAGGKGALRFNDLSLHKADTLKVKLDGNGNAMDAVGSYYYVPFFKYSNAMDAARYIVHYYNYEPDYEEHYYYRDESRINFTIIAGGNLKDLWINAYDRFYKGEIYFPVPSDSEFRNYFTLRNPSVQSISPYNYFRLKDSDGNIQGVEFSRMTCRYISTEDAYEIELFYKCKDSFWERKTEMSAGIFKCSANGTEWNRVSAGTLDEQLNRDNTTFKGTGNAQVDLFGSGKVEAYIPSPSDGEFTQPWYGGFGFDLNELKTHPNVSYDGKTDGVVILYKDSKQSDKAAQAPCVKVQCMYNSTNKAYELTIKYKENWNWDASEKGPITLIWQDGGTGWTLK